MAMNKPPESDPPDGPADLEDLVAGYIDRLTEGEKIDRYQILAEHPSRGLQIVEHQEAFVNPALVADSNEPLGTLGDYTLRRQIGRGGMGVVYEAWEGSMNRRVALKVLPAGVAADERAVSRFIREAQLAGRLNHPNVVSVYGMGVKEQTPYYAMEYVEGETLAQVLARIKDAAPDTDTPFGKKDGVRYFQTLAEAFADVADGLQHAHANKVIHRDIKPSNLIMDRDGRLRILDFGLARLEGQESLTISGDVVGTLQYMSPEQARRKEIPVDHRTDLYSLGATLYEALTLKPPFRGKDHADTLSQIISRDPERLRKLNQRIPRDLETIILKCLRKDASERYRTAEALAQDLRRFVRGDPIEAHPQAAWERFARRLWGWRWLAAGAATVLALALLGLTFSAVLISQSEKRAQLALDDAQKQFRRAQTAVDKFLTLVADEDLAVQPGKETARLEFLDAALKFYQVALKEKGQEHAVLERTALAYKNVARLYLKQGDSARAEETGQQAIRLFEALGETQSPDAMHRSGLADCCTVLGLVHLESGRFEESRPHFERAVAEREKLVQDFPGEAVHRRDLGAALANLALDHVRQVGSALGAREDLEKARALITRAIEESKAALEASPTDPKAKHYFSLQQGNLGNILNSLGDSQGAEKHLKEALALRRELISAFPLATEYRERFVADSISLGVHFQFDTRKPAEAEKAYREALMIQEKLVGDFPLTPDHKAQLGAILNNLAMLLMERGELKEVRELLRRAVEEQTAAAKANPKQPTYRQYLANHWLNIASLLEKEEKFPEAEEAQRKAIQLTEELRADFPRSHDLRVRLTEAQADYASLVQREGRHEDAAALLQKVVSVEDEMVRETAQGRPGGAPLVDGPPRGGEEHLRMLLTQFPESGSHRNHLGDSLRELAAIELAQGDLAKARELALGAVCRFEEGVKLRPGYARYQEDLVEGHLLLGEILEHSGDYGALARQADEIVKAAAEPESLFRAATLQARALRRAREDASLSEDERRRVVKEHTNGAVRLLREAVGKGLKDTARLWAAEELGSLRGQPEFEELLGSLPASPEREGNSLRKEERRP